MDSVSIDKESRKCMLASMFVLKEVTDELIVKIVQA